MCSPLAQDCLEPEGFTTPLFLAREAFPSTVIARLQGDWPQVWGGIEYPNHGTLCPCHHHPGPTKSYLNGCPDLHACPLQSVLSGWRELVRGLSQTIHTLLQTLQWLPPHPSESQSPVSLWDMILTCCHSLLQPHWPLCSHTIPRTAFAVPSPRSALFSNLCTAGSSLNFMSWLKCHLLRGACPTSLPKGSPKALFPFPV